MRRETSDRALLQCISTEAAAEGLAAGIPVFQARRLCPALTIIPPNPMLAAKGNLALVELASHYSPVVEPAAGRLFVDLTGSLRLFGTPRDVAARLEKAISTRLGLDARAGAGVNKLVSRVAADLLPEPGVYDVLRGSERDFLAPFPVSVIPGIGREREGLLLRDLNLRRVKEVAALSIPQLRLAVGPFAPLLHERSCGIDRSPVQIPRRSTEIVEEAFLEEEENDDAVLLSELLRLVESCGLRLRRLGKATTKLSLSITYADGVTEQGTGLLSAPLSLDLPLFSAVEDLFFTTCKRRLRVRGLRLSCGCINENVGQMELFAASVCETSPKYAALQETLDALREKHGKETIRWGRGMVPAKESFVIAEPLQAWDPEETRYMTLTKNGK